MPVSGSRSGLGLTLRLRIQIRYQKHEKSQLKNKYWKKIAIIWSKKLGHVSGYVSRERGATPSVDINITLFKRMRARERAPAP